MAETFHLAPDPASARAAADALFARVAPQLEALLPPSREVLHVGATAIPGCLTKGDLDILVRVDPADFAVSETLLAGRFERNSGSIRTDEFAAFEDHAVSPHLGIQLVAKGGAFDDFHRFAQRLRADPALVQRYNDLKVRYDGEPMSTYRAAKDAFIAEVLEG